MAATLIQRSRSLLNSELWILHFAIRELRLNNIPPTLLPIHPATVLSGYFIFKPLPKCRQQHAVCGNWAWLTGRVFALENARLLRKGRSP